VTVLYSARGTATLGIDYTLDGPSGEIIIPAGQASADVHMHAAALASTTSGRTKAKTVKLALTTSSAYKMPKRVGKAATVKILPR